MILLSLERSGRGFGRDTGSSDGGGFSRITGDGRGDGHEGYVDGNGNGSGYGYGNGRTDSTVTTNTLHSATVLTVATQLITYYGGRWA